MTNSQLLVLIGSYVLKNIALVSLLLIVLTVVGGSFSILAGSFLLFVAVLSRIFAFYLNQRVGKIGIKNRSLYILGYILLNVAIFLGTVFILLALSFTDGDSRGFITPLVLFLSAGVGAWILKSSITINKNCEEGNTSSKNSI